MTEVLVCVRLGPLSPAGYRIETFCHAKTQGVKNKPQRNSSRLSDPLRLCVKLLSPVLHTGLSIFLEKVADIDCEAFELLVESLSRS